MRFLVLAATLVGCRSGGGPDALDRTIERGLAGCEYTYEAFDADAVFTGGGRGAYDQNGDHVNDTILDVETGDTVFAWDATYGSPHEIATVREHSPWGDPPDQLETWTWEDGLLLVWELDVYEDGVVDGRTEYAYDDEGHRILTVSDTNADGEPERVIDEAWTWTETDTGWTVEGVQEDQDGNVTTQQLQLDPQERLLRLRMDAGENWFEQVIEGYGALQWAAHAVQTSGQGAAVQSQVETDRVLDEEGRWTSLAFTYETFDASGAITSSYAGSEERAWSCP